MLKLIGNSEIESNNDLQDVIKEWARDYGYDLFIYSDDFIVRVDLQQSLIEKEDLESLRMYISGTYQDRIDYAMGTELENEEKDFLNYLRNQIAILDGKPLKTKMGRKVMRKETLDTFICYECEQERPLFDKHGDENYEYYKDNKVCMACVHEKYSFCNQCHDLYLNEELDDNIECLKCGR